MTLFQSLVLGIIQGATEFIPVSSSGHLVIAPLLFGWNIQPEEAFIFDVLAQAATLTAVVVYYWQDLMAIASHFFQGLRERNPFKDHKTRLGWYLILSTLPAGAAALLFKETIEEAFSSPKAAAFFLLGTSALLISAEIVKTRSRTMTELNWVDALWVGFFQVLALFPGISRSGSTISGGMLRGIRRPDAAHYGFLMAVPVMTAAGLLAVIELVSIPQLWKQIPVYLAGFAAAALVGYAAIHWLIEYLSQKSLLVFAIYCAVVGTGILVVYF